jgi:hypothetical protein
LTVPPDTFATACRAAFDALAERYGFAAAEVEALGPETYVRYRRGERTISICFERGLPPIIELFHPATEPGEAALPWARRNGVDRSRRGLRIPHAGNFPPAEANLDAYLRACAAALEQGQQAWLAP